MNANEPPSTVAAKATDLTADPVPHAKDHFRRAITVDRNTVLYLTSWASGAGAAVYTGQWAWALVIPLAFFVLTELLYFGLGIEVYSHTHRVRRAYEWFDTYLDGAFGRGRDLTEAFFDGDETKSFDQALDDKFERFIELLGLESGDRLLDIGCGYGDFIAYARGKGIDARGVTLSKHHAYLCQLRGLDVVVADARDLPEEYFGQFDAVSFLGCIEHFGNYVTHASRAPGDSLLKRTDRTEHDRLLASVYETAYRCLDPESRIRRVLSSTIHETIVNPTGLDWLHGYLVERHYSGLYPLGDEGLVKNSTPWFEEIYRRDATDDYRLASERDPLHFGNFKVIWTARRLAFVPLLAILDPFCMHKWAYHVLGSWMWQFGGVGGLPKDQRPVTLWWYVLQAREPAAVA